MECRERRSISEYASTSNGVMTNYKHTYDVAMGSINQKVTNSYNVVGSDWTLRRIIFNGNVTLFAPRLVKGIPPKRDLSMVRHAMKKELMQRYFTADLYERIFLEDLSKLTTGHKEGRFEKRRHCFYYEVDRKHQETPIFIEKFIKVRSFNICKEFSRFVRRST